VNSSKGRQKEQKNLGLKFAAGRKCNTLGGIFSYSVQAVIKPGLLVFFGSFLA